VYYDEILKNIIHIECPLFGGGLGSLVEKHISFVFVTCRNDKE